MAINKNFVIKNGVQVSTDLIIGDTDTNKVGIGTTVPHYDLHVGVARGSRGGIGVTDAVVAGVATINQLSVTGISTFAGALDVNSTVDFAGDVVFNGTNDITYDQSESALVFNDGAAIRVGTGSDFSIMHDGNNTILRERGTGALKILSNSVELLGATAGETLAKFNENGNVELYHDNTKHFEVVAIGATVFGDLTISGVTTSKELNVSSGSTFGGNVDVNANIDVSGNSVLNGDVDLGNATSDTITATGRFDSDIVPSTDGARDLGASSLEFKDLYVDGVGYIDSIESDNPSPLTGDINDVTIEEARILALDSFATQNRAVTKSDYISLVYRMPPELGGIKRVNVFQDNDSLKRNINLYVLSEDSDGNLTRSSGIIKNNLKTWLNQYKMINDSIDILDAHIVNIGIDFSIVAQPNINKYDALVAALQKLQSEMLNPKFNIGEPFLITDVYKHLKDVDEVLDVVDVNIVNRTSVLHSGVYYDIQANKSMDGRILNSKENICLEIKYADDIKGVVL